MAAVTEYTLRCSPRARRVRVSVESDGAVHVTLPRRASAREADEAVRELRAVDRAAAPCAGPRRGRGGAHARTVPYLDTELALVAQPGRTRVHRRGDTLPGARDRPPARRPWSAGSGAPRGPRLARGSTPRSRAPAPVLHRPDDPRPAHALGVVLGGRGHVVSTGGCCSRPRRCSTTSSSTKSVTSRSWTTRRSSGGCPPGEPGARLARALALAAALRPRRWCSEPRRAAPRRGSRRPPA